MNVENLDIALQVFITGFIVVFSILLLLIAVIKIYSTIIYNHNTKTKNLKQSTTNIDEQKFVEQPKHEIITTPQVDIIDDSLELVAVISAAVYSIYGEENVTVKSIKKSQKTRPVWSTAGILDNTRPF